MNHDKPVTQTIGHLIDGQIVNDTARTQAVFNPATGQVSGHVALASKATVEQAIASAEKAFPEWRNTPPLKRARVMSKLKVLLEENADKIAQLITGEHGKVLNDAHGELQRGIENVEYASYAPELLKGEHSRNVGPGIDSWAEYQALGVTAGITPFNFPAHAARARDRAMTAARRPLPDAGAGGGAGWWGVLVLPPPPARAVRVGWPAPRLASPIMPGAPGFGSSSGAVRY